MVRAFPELDTSEFPYTEAKIRDSKSFGDLCINPLNEWVGLEGSLSARVSEWLPLSYLAIKQIFGGGGERFPSLAEYALNVLLSGYIHVNPVTAHTSSTCN